MNIKKFVISFVIFVLVAGILDLFCFWAVSEYTKCFLISLAFLNGSILVLGFSSFLMSRKGKYLYVSLLDASIISGYTIVCVILNFFFAIFRLNDVSVNVRVNVILLVVYLIILFIVFANTAAVTEQLEHDKTVRNAYYKFKDKAELLLGRGNNIQINKRLEFLYDKICSCQIDSGVCVQDIDDRILAEIDRLQADLENQVEDAIIISKINVVLRSVEERNQRIVNTLKR